MRFRAAALVILSAVGLVAGVAAAVAATGPSLEGARSAAPSTPSSSSPPAWTGELAYVSRGKLTILGRSGARHVVGLPSTGVPSEPSWSHDGRWLSFFVLSRAEAPYGPPGRLWVVRADGADAHSVGNAYEAAWDPSADSLAYIDDGKLSLLSTEGSPAVLPPLGASGAAETISWGPGGRVLAVSTRILTANGGVGHLVLLARGTSHASIAATSSAYGFLLAGWWPDGRGVLYWEDEDFSGSIAADGLPLASRNLSSGRTHVLASTLPHPEWVSWSPNGATVAVVAGMDRVVWNGAKHVVLCQAATGACQAEPQPEGSTAIDPAWSASGKLYFARSTGTSAYTMGTPPVRGLAPGPPFRWQAVEAWAAAGGLRVVSAVGGEPEPSAAVRGGAAGQAPTPAGSGLLFVRSGALWSLPSHSNVPTEITGRLGPYGAANPGYYGYVDWQETFAWHA